MATNNGQFTTDSREVKNAKCGVCGTKMNVNRNVFGPTQWGEAMGGGGHLHDFFHCPNLEEDWHEDLVELTEELDNTASRKIKSIMKEEISETLKTRRDRRRKS